MTDIRKYKYNIETVDKNSPLYDCCKTIPDELLTASKKGMKIFSLEILSEQIHCTLKPSMISDTITIDFVGNGIVNIKRGALERTISLNDNPNDNRYYFFGYRFAKLSRVLSNDFGAHIDF